MAQLVEIISSDSSASLQDAVNAFLAPLLTHAIQRVDLVVGDGGRYIGKEYRVSIFYQTGAGAIGTPYQVYVDEAASPAALEAAIQARIDAQPAYFFAPSYLQYAGVDSRTKRNTSLLVYNTVLANGLANWIGGGTIPSPETDVVVTGTLTNGVPTLMDAVPLASIGDALWEVEIVKATTRYSCSIRATHDATTPQHTEYGDVVAPPAGTVDVTFNVDASAGTMRLMGTASSVGWAFRVRRRTLVA